MSILEEDLKDICSAVGCRVAVLSHKFINLYQITPICESKRAHKLHHQTKYMDYPPKKERNIPIRGSRDESNPSESKKKSKLESFQGPRRGKIEEFESFWVHFEEI